MAYWRAFKILKCHTVKWVIFTSANFRERLDFALEENFAS